MSAIFCSCATLPSYSEISKKRSYALPHPEQTRLGQRFELAERNHPGESGFRLIQAGADGFLMRMQMIAAAEHSLDLQYFIFHGDKTGKLLTEAVLKAADRGVRVRVLVDDGETEPGDEQIAALSAHPAIEIRIFNPFAYRGHFKLFKSMEFLFNATRLDYRMHNKLLVVDNAIALVGGRNIGDQYFQIDPESQFADDDVFAAGAIVQKLSATFDEFWNCDLSIPAELLSYELPTVSELNQQRQLLNEEHLELKAEGLAFVKRVTSGKPFQDIVEGRLPIVWAQAQLIYDSPDKKQVDNGILSGRLIHPAIMNAARTVQSELLMVTPYLIPDEEGIQLFKNLRTHHAKILILTNSLQSADMSVAQSGYMHYRIPLLEDGVQLYEIRSQLGNSKGSGQSPSLSKFGHYGLHAKLYVFDRKRLFIGSMNFDQRSKHLNTEIGLIIDSPTLAQQVAERFQSMVQPANAYRLAIQPNPEGGEPSLVWHTQEKGKAIVYDTEPARSDWQSLKVNVLSLLPVDDEL
ncbi:phospholipase D family protein [Methylomonas sp. AM2-LC]|uniref:phospholipase D family protein n=1 Tax=Methylomonas sp. AM2-LC TaxID=3153301 RepID=UPI003265E32D